MTYCACHTTEAVAPQLGEKLFEVAPCELPLEGVGAGLVVLLEPQEAILQFGQ